MTCKKCHELHHAIGGSRTGRCLVLLLINGDSVFIPISDTHPLTIGREGSKTSLQIFDVSDLSAPKLLHKEIPDNDSGNGYSYSSATYDHNAFTYYAPKQILIIPYSYSTYNVSAGNTYFNGFLSYRISLQDGFTEQGRVDHADLAEQKYCGPISVSNPDKSTVCENYGYINYGNPRRSIIMTSAKPTSIHSRTLD